MSYLSQLATKRHSRPGSPRANAAPQENLTAQQLALAQCAPAGIIKANAFAGTGKTSSLTALAMNQANQQCLYLTFNKSAQMDAATRFGPNTRCATIHSIAFGVTGKRYAHKLGNLRAMDVIKQMGLRWDFVFANLVIGTIEAWCTSDWTEFPKTAQTVNGPAVGWPLQLAEAAGVAEQVWQRMCEPGDPMPMMPDGYLKLFQLTNPRLGCDLLMLDEAQDTNPVTWAIIRAQQCPIIIVGDRYQSIYKFRGAINAMDTVNASQEFPLTQSFRFGPRVARIATELLSEFHGEIMPVEGLGPDTVIAPPPEGAAYTLVARTNATVFHEAVVAVRSGKPLGFAGGVHAYGFEKLLDVQYLSEEDTGSIRDPFIRSFASISDYDKYAMDSGDPEAKRQIEIVSTYGAQIHTLIPEIHRRAQKDLSKAQLVLTTAHRSKGLTCDHVVLADDYPELLDGLGMPLDADVLDRQEVNLLYVALTRARLSLKINSVLREFIIECGAGEILLGQQTAVAAITTAEQANLF